jgi:hypothetical protein
VGLVATSCHARQSIPPLAETPVSCKNLSDSGSFRVE